MYARMYSHTRQYYIMSDKRGIAQSKYQANTIIEPKSTSMQWEATLQHMLQRIAIQGGVKS